MNADDAFAHVADVAAQHFLSRGYKAVSLRAIAGALGMKAASLYYHCPGGKSELYARSLSHYLSGYRAALADTKGRARYPEALYRMADWMLENPAVDFQRLIRLDLPQLEAEHAEQVSVALHGVLEPLVEVLTEAKTRGAIRRQVDLGIAASAVLALVQGLGFLHLPTESASREQLTEARRLVRSGVELIVRGAAPAR